MFVCKKQQNSSDAGKLLQVKSSEVSFQQILYNLGGLLEIDAVDPLDEFLEQGALLEDLLGLEKLEGDRFLCMVEHAVHDTADQDPHCVPHPVCGRLHVQIDKMVAHLIFVGHVLLLLQGLLLVDVFVRVLVQSARCVQKHSPIGQFDAVRDLEATQEIGGFIHFDLSYQSLDDLLVLDFNVALQLLEQSVQLATPHFHFLPQIRVQLDELTGFIQEFAPLGTFLPKTHDKIQNLLDDEVLEQEQLILVTVQVEDGVLADILVSVYQELIDVGHVFRNILNFS